MVTGPALLIKVPSHTKPVELTIEEVVFWACMYGSMDSVGPVESEDTWHVMIAA